MHKKKITIVEGSPKNVKFRRSLLHFKTFSTKNKHTKNSSSNHPKQKSKIKTKRRKQ